MKYLKRYSKFESAMKIDELSPMTDECQLALHKFIENEGLSKDQTSDSYINNLELFLKYQEETGDPNDWSDSIKSEIDTYKDSFVKPSNNI